MATAKKPAASKSDANSGKWDKRALRWVKILSTFKDLRKQIGSAAEDGIVSKEEAHGCLGQLADAECCILDSGVPE